MVPLHLASRLGSAVDKDELLHAVWHGVVVTDDSFVKCIGEIRRALGDDDHRIVRTEPKRGYRLMSEATSAVAGEHDFSQDIRYCMTAVRCVDRLGQQRRRPGAVRTAHWMTTSTGTGAAARRPAHPRAVAALSLAAL